MTFVESIRYVSDGKSAAEKGHSYKINS